MNTFFVRLEPHPESVVEHAQRTITIAHDGFWHHGLHFLRNHPDIRTIAAVVAEAIVAKPVCQVPEKNDIMLEHDIGPPAAATTPAAAATESTTSAATESTATPHAQAAATTGARKACTPARGLPLGYPTGADISKGVAATSSA